MVAMTAQLHVDLDVVKIVGHADLHVDLVVALVVIPRAMTHVVATVVQVALQNLLQSIRQLMALQLEHFIQIYLVLLIMDQHQAHPVHLMVLDIPTHHRLQAL